ncbi:AraC family transcriptional regulator [Methanolobus bombayensis]|uniref:AraC family transcriptional regulator n=1 Tax=Methanolobus bombayensis TaxID=38023 RepID=UPI001FD85682|nr:GyrI-like domain-containing protein [Methanolobus bombayensis]MBP1910268.1 AraC family transcriptional regulator [Methanolobus bombayensis]
MLRKPAIKNIEEQRVAYVSFVGNYIGNVEVFASLFGKLGNWAGSKHLMGPNTVFMSAYYDDPGVTPPEELKLDACMTIEDSVEVEGEIKKKTLPGGKYVTMRAELSGAEDYGIAWEKIVEWLMQNKLGIDMSRASYEIYLNDPEEHPQKHHIVDICMPVNWQDSK